MPTYCRIYLAANYYQGKPPEEKYVCTVVVGKLGATHSAEHIGELAETVTDHRKDFKEETTSLIISL